MPLALGTLLVRVKTALRLPDAAEIRLTYKETGIRVNSRIEVEPLYLKAFLEKQVTPDTTITTIIREVKRRIGAVIGINMVIYLNGREVPGKTALKSIAQRS